MISPCFASLCSSKGRAFHLFDPRITTRNSTIDPHATTHFLIGTPTETENRVSHCKHSQAAHFNRYRFEVFFIWVFSVLTHSTPRGTWVTSRLALCFMLCYTSRKEEEMASNTSTANDLGRPLRRSTRLNHTMPLTTPIADRTGRKSRPSPSVAMDAGTNRSMTFSRTRG